MIVRSLMKIFRPAASALLTSSSQTKSATGFGTGADPAALDDASGSPFSAAPTWAIDWDGGAPEPTRPAAGRISYARRLMLMRWRGEGLSDVMVPPGAPHPGLIAGSNPVVSPIDPCVVGVLTTIRYAGFFSPNSRITRSSCEWMDMVW